MPLPSPVTRSQILVMSREVPCRVQVALALHLKNFHKYQRVVLARGSHFRDQVPVTRYGYTGGKAGSELYSFGNGHTTLNTPVLV